MTTLSFSLTPFAFAYAAGVGVAFVLLIQMTRIKFKRRYHQIFIAAGASALLFLAIRIWQVSANDAQTFLIAFFPWWIFGLLNAALGAHFVMRFVSPSLTNLQKSITIAVYAWALFLIAGSILNIDILSVRSAVRFPSGWVIVIPYEGFILYVAYLATVVLVIYGYLIRHYLALESPFLKSQSLFLLVGLIFIGVGAIATQMSGQSIPPIDWLTSPAGLGLVLVGFRKHNFFTSTPISEEQSSSPPKYELTTGLVYLFLDAEPKRIFEIFDDLIEHGHFGLCLTRVFPDTVRREYAIQTAPVRWLSESNRADAIAPTDLLGLALTIRSFLEKAEEPVVLLHGLEYLVFNNGFRPILRMIHQIGELNAQKQGIFLLPLASGSLTERQEAMLRPECRTIKSTELGLKAWLKGTSKT